MRNGKRGRDARGGADVTEALTVDWHELPVVAPALERELDHTPGPVFPQLAVSLLGDAVVQRVAASADDELADAGGCGTGVGVLRRVALVVVVVPVEDDVVSLR
jgi:hypothetical protein